MYLSLLGVLAFKQLAHFQTEGGTPHRFEVALLGPDVVAPKELIRSDFGSIATNTTLISAHSSNLSLPPVEHLHWPGFAASSYLTRWLGWQ